MLSPSVNEIFVDFSMALHGTSSSTRGGFAFALSSGNEAIGGVLSSKLKKIPTQMVALIGLEKTEVKTFH